MSDCPDTVYYPIEPYASVEDLCGVCKNVVLDPETEPNDIEAFEQRLLYASRRVFIATGGRWSGCITTTWEVGCRSTWPCCGRASEIGCDCDGDFIELPDGAIRTIVEVKIDDEADRLRALVTFGQMGEPFWIAEAEQAPDGYDSRA